VKKIVDFCPKCSNLLRKKLLGTDYLLECKCGYKKKFTEDLTEERNNTIKKKKEALKDNLIVISTKEKILVHPKTLNTCPKCGHGEAVFWQEQLYSADEPMVTFFRCLKCNRVYREY